MQKIGYSTNYFLLENFVVVKNLIVFGMLNLLCLCVAVILRKQEKLKVFRQWVKDFFFASFYIRLALESSLFVGIVALNEILQFNET